jgi:hypothetical protein
MSRDHARFQTAIHHDPDWRRLDQSAQHTYMMLTTHPDLSYCGVIDYLPSRWVGSTNGLTETKIKASIRTLERAKYVVADRATSELFVRSFIRHDKILARRNMGNACGRALGLVHSEVIRDAVLHELARLWLEDSGRDGWAGFKDFDPMAFDMACAMASRMACAMEEGV